jgi:hypothetical protein
MKRNEPVLIWSGVGEYDLARIARMKVPELRRLYRELFGTDPPAGNSECARRKIAWHLQAEREGPLPESAQQRALGIASAAPLSLRVLRNLNRRSSGQPLEHSVTTHVVADQDSRLPMPGTHFSR